jgi:hypothetical protein
MPVNEAGIPLYVVFPSCVDEFNDVISPAELRMIVERVAACAGVSSVNANAADAAVASANFALRVNFIVPP